MALLWFVSGTLAWAQPVSREYQLKAVFLFNFAQFTHWPTNAFAGTNDPIVIGVLGRNPFGDALGDTVRGETVGGRPLSLEHYSRVEEATNCHILFIAPSESRRTQRAIDVLRQRPVLTVGDEDTAEGRAVMIRFVEQNNKLRIRVNLDAVNDAHLTLSSKLLRAAEIVSSGRQ
ncbi:MAG TPA: YfiR family protein [Verrucomicrobiae bacterium]|nr:YfiR family protein [Verrucomicrobiae bacterium]